MPVHRAKMTGFDYFLGKTKAAKFFLWAVFCLLETVAHADALDADVMQDGLLATLSDALAAYEIDVTSNLNARDIVRQRIQRPRLGRFADLPPDSLPGSIEIYNWEAEYLASQIGGIAIIARDAVERSEDSSNFLHDWLLSSSQHRYFISFLLSDLPVVEKIESVANAYGFQTRLFTGGQNQALVGNLFSTAAQRLAVDTRDARKYRSNVVEFDYLGERARRNSESLFRDDGNKGNRSLARREPAVFLKESLGDEFNQSTINEIIVPGGVALGVTASLAITPESLQFAGGRLQLVDDEQVVWQLPKLDSPSMKALFDFVQRSESIKSDAIVDIDADARVRISSALRDTEVGYEIMHADTLPFEYVPNLPVTKSVVIDVDIHWQGSSTENKLEFETEYEVRFLSADNMRIAQTRVGLQYQFESETSTAVYKDSWGRDVRRLRDNLDYAGLGNDMVEVANYAGWIGLLRKLKEDKVPFLQGRYEFMKIDKSGRKTPARY